MAQWKQYSGMWTRQQQMQAASAQTWPGIYLGSSLYSWGENLLGTLGLNDIVYRSSPTQVGTLVNWQSGGSGGSDKFTVAIKSDGTMWSWGNNTYGTLGQNNLVNRSSPVQIGALTTWSKVACGQLHSAAIKTDGTLWTWGVNNYGQLGDSSIVYRSSPVQVGSLTTWRSVSCGTSFTNATRTNNSLYAWGRNNSYQLGTNNATDRSAPVQIGGLVWVDSAAGSNFAFATRLDGTMWSWGANSVGQCAQPDTTYSVFSPTQVGALTTWASLSASGEKPFLAGRDSGGTAIKIDGTLWSWGANSVGQLGDRTVVSRSSPVQIGSGTSWNQIKCGDNFSLATKTDGTLWSWGYNSYGELGQNNVTSKSSPVQVGSKTNWGNVWCSRYAAFGVLDQYTS